MAQINIKYFLLVFTSLCNLVKSTQLPDHIVYYEPVIYQRIVKRSTSSSMYLNFRAFQRDFRLVLSHGSSVIAPNSKLVVARGLNSTFIPSYNVTRHLVIGKVENINDSDVRGYFTNNVFEGIINVPEEIYYLEPSSNYFSEPVSFASIIYRYSDVNRSMFKYQDIINNNLSQKVFQRKKREISPKSQIRSVRETGKGPPTKCTLKIIVDHTYYQQTTARTFDFIIAKLVSIMSAVNKVFESIDFDLDGKPDGIGFKIREFIIWWTQEQPGYRMSNENLNLEDYLRTIGLDESSRVCLVLAVTARHFDGRYISSSRQRTETHGGICSNDIENGFRENVAVVSLYQQGVHVTNALAEQIILHEFGHSFGASHDSKDNECKRSPSGDRFIMHATLTPISNKGHKFSACSIRSMASSISSVQSECFIHEDEFKSCGNGFIDSPQEQCDCGHADQCNNIDECCALPDNIVNDTKCHYRESAGATCSYREDKCCNVNCKLFTVAEKQHCNENFVCKEPSLCDGVSKDCPPSANKEDGIPCRGNLGICKQGVCEDIICNKSKMTPCECSSVEFNCHLCCSYHGLCLTARKFGLFPRSKKSYLRPDGESCMNGDGYCISGYCLLILRSEVQSPTPEIQPQQSDVEFYGFGYLLFIVLVANFVVVVLALLFIMSYKKYRRRRQTQAPTRTTQAENPNVEQSEL